MSVIAEQNSGSFRSHGRDGEEDPNWAFVEVPEEKLEELDV